jgi:hypothetical protein
MSNPADTKLDLYLYRRMVRETTPKNPRFLVSAAIHPLNRDSVRSGFISSDHPANGIIDSIASLCCPSDKSSFVNVFANERDLFNSICAETAFCLAHTAKYFAEQNIDFKYFMIVRDKPDSRTITRCYFIKLSGYFRLMYIKFYGYKIKRDQASAIMQHEDNNMRVALEHDDIADFIRAFA